DQGGQDRHPLDAPVLPPLPGQRGPPAARCHCLQLRQSAAPAGSPRPHPDVVLDQSPAPVVQDRPPPHPTCAVLRGPAGRKSLDRESLSADPRAHRAADVPPDLIERTAPFGSKPGDAGGSVSEGGGSVGKPVEHAQPNHASGATTFGSLITNGPGAS